MDDYFARLRAGAFERVGATNQTRRAAAEPSA